jgi:hypothetical protein
MSAPPVGLSFARLEFHDPDGAGFRASVEAKAAARATLTGILCRMVAGAVELLRDLDAFLRANVEAKLTSLAKFGVDFHVRFVRRHGSPQGGRKAQKATSET